MVIIINVLRFFALASYLAARGIYQAYAAARVVEMIIYYLVCSLKAMAHDKRATRKNQVKKFETFQTVSASKG